MIMKWKSCISLTMIALILGALAVQAQEEESAELYLEEYTDEFQEAFFEALKQKGIENYDKSINLLLECKRLEPDNTVVDFELAKIYLLEKEYISALEYSLESLAQDPGNYWYLHTLVDILQGQGRAVEEVADRIPYSNRTLKENLALIYYKRSNYRSALQVLEELQGSNFADKLSSSIKDSMDQASQSTNRTLGTEEEAEEDPIENYKEQLENLLKEENYDALEEMASEAAELFPLQPYFYYMLGKSLAEKGNTRQAIGVLESALDLLLDDMELANDIYRELSGAYKLLGNEQRSNMYLSKIKNGS